MGTSPSPALCLGMLITSDDEGLPWGYDPDDEDWSFGRAVEQLEDELSDGPFRLLYVGDLEWSFDSAVIAVKALTIDLYDSITDIDLPSLVEEYKNYDLEAAHKWAEDHGFEFTPEWLLSASNG